MNRAISFIGLVFVGMFLLGVHSVSAAVYDSCVDAYEQGETDSGYYDIDGADNVYCEMDDNGGGWLRITPTIARDLFDGLITFEDGKSDTDYGFDSNDRPYTQDDEGAHTAHFTFDLPFKAKEFYLKDYVARSNSASNDSSDIYPSRFEQEDWDVAHDESVGDISFGFADDDGPVTSYARELSVDTIVNRYGLLQWPEDEKIYKTSTASDSFRISWGDEGEPAEGWWPWWSGYIFVRESEPDNSNGTHSGDLNISVQSVNVENDNDVQVKVEVSGEPSDEDAKIRVEFEDNEGGSCSGDWEQAEIKSGVTASNKDGSNNPSVDSAITYQIGSSSDKRVIADGDDNTVTFTWAAEEDIDSNPSGEYCIRVSVRADSGETDSATKVVDFDNNSIQGDDLEITSPEDKDTISDRTPLVSGYGIDYGNTVRVRGPENERCTATVSSSNKWSCTLSPSLEDGWNEVCAIEEDGDGDEVGEQCIEVYVSDGSISTPNYPSGVIRINSPVNGSTITTNNPAIIGVGNPGSVIQVDAVGKSCTATVLPNGGWTCTLTLLPAGTYSVVATQRTQSGVQTGYTTSSFTIAGKQCPVFSRYHKIGESGGEIPQLQEFLRDKGYYNGGITGYFDAMTDHAIKDFQLEYRSLILDPWGIPAPTGYWYKTTRKHANFLSGCYETVYLEGVGVTF